MPFLAGEKLPTRPFVELLPQSEVFIHVKSNISDFTLSFSFEDHEDRIVLESISTDTDTEYKIQSITLNIPIEKFKCDNGILKNEFKKTMKADTYPDILVHLDHVIISGQSNFIQSDLMAQITAGGIQKPQTVHYNVKSLCNGQVTMQGSVELDLKEYNMEIKKKLFGLVQVDQTINIDFLFKLALHK